MAVKSLYCYANGSYKLLDWSTKVAGDPRNWGMISHLDERRVCAHKSYSVLRQSASRRIREGKEELEAVQARSAS